MADGWTGVPAANETRFPDQHSDNPLGDAYVPFQRFSNQMNGKNFGNPKMNNQF